MKLGEKKHVEVLKVLKPDVQWFPFKIEIPEDQLSEETKMIKLRKYKKR